MLSSHYSVSLSLVVTKDGAAPDSAPFYTLEQSYTHLDMQQLLLIERVYAEALVRLVEAGEKFVAEQTAAGTP